MKWPWTKPKTGPEPLKPELGVLFSDIREQLHTKLKEKVADDGNKYSMVDAFTKLQLTEILDGQLRMGGQNIPCIALADKNSGEIRLFAVLALLPELQGRI